VADRIRQSLSMDAATVQQQQQQQQPASITNDLHQIDGRVIDL